MDAELCFGYFTKMFSFRVLYLFHKNIIFVIYERVIRSTVSSEAALDLFFVNFLGCLIVLHVLGVALPPFFLAVMFFLEVNTAAHCFLSCKYL